MSKKLTGKEIREFRIKAGISQPDFAKRLGFATYNRLSAIENGKLPISRAVELLFRWEQDAQSKRNSV